MSKFIIESGMTFGPYLDEHCFELEKSAIYQRIQQGVRMAEFALIKHMENKPPIIWLVEAKRSSPRQENQSEFDKFIEEIRQKLTNALHLVLAAKLNRHPEAINDLPGGFNTLSLQEEFKLVLVIKNHPKEWLPPLQDALRKTFSMLCKTFGLKPTSVAVINEQMAQSHGLIAEPQQQ